MKLAKKTIYPHQIVRFLQVESDDDEKLAVFRRVRDEIRRVFEAYAAGRLDQGKQRAAA